MDHKAFHAFLKRGGRSDSAAARAVQRAGDFERHLAGFGRSLDEAELTDLESFVATIESEPGTAANMWLWALRYYYEFSEDAVMEHAAAELWADRIDRRPFRLSRFRGVDPGTVKALSAVGITNVEELLGRGSNAGGRRELAATAGVPAAAVLELVQLSDLARIPGLKGIRARLYHSAGITTVARLAAEEAGALCDRLAAFVENSGFEGTAPLPREVEHAVATARKLPDVVEW